MQENIAVCVRECSSQCESIVMYLREYSSV
jgi:hypothetical protein